MKVRFWGTRGSIPVPGEHTLRYGGNTPCVEVVTDSQRIVLDAGTGIRALGSTVSTEETVTLFITHPHWDHIQGFPFFTPFWTMDKTFEVYGRPNVLEALERQMSAPSFPLEIKDLKGKIRLKEMGPAEVSIEGVKVDSMAVAHPNEALGYKISDDRGGSIVYIPDNELALPEAYGLGPDWRSELVKFVKGSQVLIHDATFTTKEYEARRGWGHSTCEDAVKLATDAGVETLALFHHAPERTDAELDEIIGECRNAAGMKVIGAAEMLELEIH